MDLLVGDAINVQLKERLDTFAYNQAATYANETITLILIRYTLLTCSMSLERMILKQSKEL